MATVPGATLLEMAFRNFENAALCGIWSADLLGRARLNVLPATAQTQLTMLFANVPMFDARLCLVLLLLPTCCCSGILRRKTHGRCALPIGNPCGAKTTRVLQMQLCHLAMGANAYNEKPCRYCCHVWVGPGHAIARNMEMLLLTKSPRWNLASAGHVRGNAVGTFVVGTAA